MGALSKVVLVALYCAMVTLSAEDNLDHGHMHLEQVAQNEPSASPTEGTLHVLWEGTSLTELIITSHRLDDHTLLCYVKTSQRLDSKRYELQVLYYAGAYLDDQENLHIKYLGGSLRGPQSMNWSPDNFMLNKKGRALVIDELKRSSQGVVLMRNDEYKQQAQRFMVDWTGVL